MEIEFDDATTADTIQLVRMALEEDLEQRGDLTSQSTIPEDLEATVDIVAREPGVVCGTAIIPMVFQQLPAAARVEVNCCDGSVVEAGSRIASISSHVRNLLTAERTILNFLMHLSGVATFTRRFVQEISGTQAVILDTRKTLPGFRRIHKYAVRCGGGKNHRMGLFDGILIKDNHLAARGSASVADAVKAARVFLEHKHLSLPIEIEVDTLPQLRDALGVHPEIVLLDNMTIDELRQAVAIRQDVSPRTLLEASGGVTLQTVRQIAETGVERISIGAMTHSSKALDLSFDWPWQVSPQSSAGPQSSTGPQSNGVTS